LSKNFVFGEKFSLKCKIWGCWKI